MKRGRNKRLVTLAIPAAIVAILFCSSFAYGMEGKEDDGDCVTALVEPTYELVDIPESTPNAHTLQYEPVGEPEDEQESQKDEEQPEQQELMYTEQDVIALAQMAYGEAWITQSDTEMSACMWSALNRLDSNDAFYEGCKSVKDVVSQYGQYHGYDQNNPIEERLVWLARDVLNRWQAEKNGETDVGRTLPREFCYFYGDGVRNHFTTEHNGGGFEYGWWLDSPYDN